MKQLSEKCIKAKLAPIRWCQQNGLDILNQIEEWVKDNEYIDSDEHSLIDMIWLLNKIEELKVLTLTLHPIH